MNVPAPKLASLLDCSAAEIAARWADHEVAQNTASGTEAGDACVELMIRRSVARVAAVTFDHSVSRGRWLDLVSFTVRSCYWGCWYGAWQKRLHGAEAAAEQLRTLPIALRPYTAAVLKWASTLAVRVDGREWPVPQDAEMN